MFFSLKEHNVTLMTFMKKIKVMILIIVVIIKQEYERVLKSYWSNQKGIKKMSDVC